MDVRRRTMSWPLSVLLIAFVVRTRSEQPETCSANLEYVAVEPDADLTIGAVLDLHRPGNGVFGCGQPSAKGLHYFESLKWAVQTLNRNSGYHNGNTISDSFIPGVKLGLQAYDSCGHKELAIRYMTDLFPVLKTGAHACGEYDDNVTKLIGMVDATGTSNMQRVSDAVKKSLIPVIPLSEETAVPPEQLAKVLAEVIHDTDWERVAILHGDDEYSLYVTKIFSQIAFAGFPCITSMKSFATSPYIHPTEGLTLRKTISSLTGKLPDKTGVVVIGHGDSVKRVVQVLKEVPELSRLQWLFSWLPPADELTDAIEVAKLKHVYSLSPYPQIIPAFEGYWAKLQDLASVRNVEDHWFLEYAMFKKSCRIPGFPYPSFNTAVSCENLVVRESPMDKLLKTSRFVSALHAVYTFAHAYRNAWADKCSNVPGVCQALREMTKTEFVEQFLEPLEFDHLPESRSPEGVRGQKTNHSARGEVENLQMALNVYSFSRNQGLIFKQVFAYDSQEAKILDDSFRHQPSVCPKVGCTNCVSIRQSRLDVQDYEISPTEDFVTVARSEDVLIPILLPIHRRGNNPMECGTVVDKAAVQNLEAALWTIDQINSDPEFLRGVQLGAVVIDTCSSPLTLTQRLSNFLMEMQQKSPGEFTSTLAVVSAIGKEEFTAAATVLAPLNVTIVSSSDSIEPSSVMEKYLQTTIPISTKVDAVAQTLKYLGWTYVSVVYDSDEHNKESLTLFQKYAKDADICLSAELSVNSLDSIEMDFLITQIMEARRRGSKVIVLWTTEITANVFIGALRKAVAAGVVSSSDLIIICNGEWITDLKSFDGFDNQTLGMLTFKPEQGEVTEFATYYQRLDPVKNKRNPWFGELWNARGSCNDDTASCDLASLYSPLSSTVDMMQSVLALSAGLARLRNDICRTESGLCSRLLQQPHIRELYHKYVHETASSRLDAKGEMFTFTKKGFSNIPMNIFAFRKRAGNALAYQKVGRYQNYKIDLTGSVIYSATGDELALEDISSMCTLNCDSCQGQSADFLVLDSNDDIYLAAAIGVHESTINPLICGSVLPSPGIQSLEAFLWAVDQVNSSPQLLPGVTLGTVVFDTCNSKEKTARDISNFFSNSATSVASKNLPDKQFVVGMLAAGAGDTVESIVDVTTPFKMLTIATDVTSSQFNDAERYPTLLRSSLPNDVMAEGLVDLLKHFRWNYVSVVYSDNKWQHGDLFQAFKMRTEKRKVELAVAEKLPVSASEATMRGVLTRLTLKKEKGARVVILLLNSVHMKMFFSTITKQQGAGQISTGDFVWIGVDNLEVFHTYPDVSLGAIMLRSKTSTIAPFKQYFEGLHLKNNSRNPWFSEYWEKEMKCHGASCYRKSNAVHLPLLQHPSVPSVINSVLSMAVALEAVRTRMCPGLESGLCPAVMDHGKSKEMLLNITRSSSFMGVDGKLFKFTKNNFAAGILEVFNFIQVGSNARAFIEVGQFSPDEGLFLNYSKVKTYSEGGQEMSLYNVKSQCLDVETCQNPTDQREVSRVEINPEPEFAISFVMPIHSRGKTFFECGDLKNEHMFQNLAAVSYAIDAINHNDAVLPGTSLGAVIFDYCNRRQRAEQQLYSYFSKESKHNEKAKIKPRSVFATVTYGTDVAKDLEPILDASNVLQIATPSNELSFDGQNDILYAVPSSISQVQILLSILNRFKWRYINLIYSNTDFGRSSYYQFSKGAKQIGICVAGALEFHTDSSVEFISSTLRSNLDYREAKVVVLLVDDVGLINNTIQAAMRMAILQELLWLGTNVWGTEADIASLLQNSVANALTLKLENNELPDFLDYYAKMTPRRHEPIPDAWFDNWWQHRFQCHLSDSENAQTQYTKLCSGQERLDRSLITQDNNVYHTIKVTEAVVKGLHKYLTEQCPHGRTIDDCGPNARSELEKEIKRMVSDNVPDCKECGPLGTVFGYDVFHLMAQADGNYSYTKVGDWKNGILSLNEQQILWASGSIPTSTCQKNCDKCANQLGTMENLSDIKHAIYGNFKEVWGITVSALSVFGMVMVIICALYFLMSFPVTVGTTVLGYMILFGLLLLYAVNFAFVITPTEGTCGVRRFGLGLAYAVIFSGMLVKVMNTWRIMGYNGSRMLTDGTRLSSPAGLLVIAVGLVIIQIVLSAAWLILMPPKIGAYEMVWRCAPPTTFEEGLVVSLVYVMLLLAITTLFAILTWQCQDNNRESRWILACSTMVAVIWLAWTILSTQITPHRRDLTIAAANLVNATIIMVCLYLRKVYLYSKLMRQAKDQELKTHLQPSSYPHSLYGTSQKSAFSTIAPVLYGSQASLTGKKLYNGPSSRLELINCPEDSKSDSSGSVQVQAADLYPLDMYDGGSQFQPVSSLFGSNHTLVLDDTLTFGR